MGNTVSKVWADMGYPVLVTQADIAKRHGVTRQAVTTWKVKYDSFPDPVMTVNGGATPLYMLGEVELWEHKKKLSDTEQEKLRSERARQSGRFK